tara:strand:+ start:1593 stop:1964 length:372 start_codon:yes stop_codon:yes gene_type:complete
MGMHKLEAEEKMKEMFFFPRSKEDILLWKLNYSEVNDFQQLVHNKCGTIMKHAQDIYKKWLYDTIDRFPEYFSWSIAQYRANSGTLTITVSLCDIQVCIANVDTAIEYFTSSVKYNPQGNRHE